jgi:DNA polymerase III epsilon subunit family exonuclease
VEAAIEHVLLCDAEVSVVDLETTGLSAQDCSILEIGAVRISKLRCTDSFETLVQPPGHVPRRITELTGINAALLRDAPPASEALPAFRSWLESAAGAPFAAHNAAFDARFLARGLERYALPAYEAPVLCTRRLARRLVPELGRYNLDHVCAHFGVSNRARHRALGDARAAALVMLELFRIALETGVATTLGALLDLQSKPPGKRPRRRRGSPTGSRSATPKPRS